MNDLTPEQIAEHAPGPWAERAANGAPLPPGIAESIRAKLSRIPGEV